MALATVADVKAFAGITTSNDDALLTSLINAVSVAFVKWTDRDLESTTHTDVMDGPGGSVMVLPNYPITAVTSLKIDGVSIPARPAVGEMGFSYNDFSIRLHGYRFPRDFGNIEITYTAGYTVVPDDLKQAVIETVVLRYNERRRIGETSRAVEGQATSFLREELPPFAQRVIREYSRVTTV